MSITSVFKETVERTIDLTLIQRMEAIVDRIVVNTKFRSDFYINDMKAMETCSTFAWFVYECGTHFIPLHDIEAVRTFQGEWINTLHDLMDGKKAADTMRLYVCDIHSGDLKRVYGFKEGNLIDHLKAVV